jgi:hypothetical protein
LFRNNKFIFRYTTVIPIPRTITILLFLAHPNIPLNSAKIEELRIRNEDSEKNSDFSVSARIVKRWCYSGWWKYYLDCLLGIIMENWEEQQLFYPHHGIGVCLDGMRIAE